MCTLPTVLEIDSNKQNTSRGIKKKYKKKERKIVKFQLRKLSGKIWPVETCKVGKNCWLFVSWLECSTGNPFRYHVTLIGPGGPVALQVSRKLSPFLTVTDKGCKVKWGGPTNPGHSLVKDGFHQPKNNWFWTDLQRWWNGAHPSTPVTGSCSPGSCTCQNPLASDSLFWKATKQDETSEQIITKTSIREQALVAVSRKNQQISGVSQLSSTRNLLSFGKWQYASADSPTNFVSFNFGVEKVELFVGTQ